MNDKHGMSFEEIAELDKSHTAKYMRAIDPEATIDELERLLKSNDPGIRKLVVENPNAPIEMIKRTITDEIKVVRHAAVRKIMQFYKHRRKNVDEKDLMEVIVSLMKEPQDNFDVIKAIEFLRVQRDKNDEQQRNSRD